MLRWHVLCNLAGRRRLTSHARGSKQCIFDDFTAKFLEKYRGAADINSSEARCVLEALALITWPDTVRMERSHAQQKRSSRGFEATHAQQLVHVSALKVLSKVRLSTKSWHRTVLRRPAAANAASTARGSANVANERRRHAPGRCRLWMRANARGRIGADAYQRYWKAMEDQAERQKYDIMARAARQAPEARQQRKRKWSRVDSEVRRRRFAAKRAKRQWNSGGERRLAEATLAQPLQQKWQHAVTAHRERTKAARMAHEQAVAVLIERARTSAGKVPAAFGSICGELVFECDGVLRWAPDWSAVATTRVSARVGIENQLLSWEELHTPICGEERIAAETNAAKKRRLCREAGVCVSHKPGRCVRDFVHKIRAMVSSLSGKAAKTKSQTRQMFEEGRGILRFTSSGGDELFTMVARVRWEPSQLILLALVTRSGEAAAEKDSVVLSVGRSLPPTHRLAPWFLDVDFAALLDRKLEWFADAWGLESVVEDCSRAGGDRFEIFATSCRLQRFRMWGGALEEEAVAGRDSSDDGHEVDSEASDRAPDCVDDDAFDRAAAGSLGAEGGHVAISPPARAQSPQGPKTETGPPPVSCNHLANRAAALSRRPRTPAQRFARLAVLPPCTHPMRLGPRSHTSRTLVAPKQASDKVPGLPGAAWTEEKRPEKRRAPDTSTKLTGKSQNRPLTMSPASPWPPGQRERTKQVIPRAPSHFTRVTRQLPQPLAGTCDV